MAGRPEDFGGSGSADFGTEDNGAHASFHDLVWRGPQGHGGGHNDDVQRDIVNLAIDLAREGRMDPSTAAALRMLEDRVSGHHRGGGHYGNNGGRTDCGWDRLVDEDMSPQYSTALDSGIGAQLDPTVDSTAQQFTSPMDNTIPATNNGVTDSSATTANAGQLDQSSIQTLAGVWAASHGMDINDPQSFQQVAQSSDGKSIAVGPYQLDGNIIGAWFSQSVDQNGSINPEAMKQMVADGKISQQTADAVSSPDFATFMQGLMSGQQPTADQVAKFLPADLQNTIASDMVTGMSSSLAQQNGGQLDPGVLIASLESRKPLGQTELQDPNIQQFVSSINSALTGDQSTSTTQGQVVQPQTDTYVAPTTTTDQTSGVGIGDSSGSGQGPITISQNPDLAPVTDQSGG
jgi:hypothetical protein